MRTSSYLPSFHDDSSYLTGASCAARRGVPTDHCIPLHSTLAVCKDDPDLVWGGGGESEDGERRENRIGSASQIIIAVAIVASVAVTLLPITLILSLVDPLEYVWMAKY